MAGPQHGSGNREPEGALPPITTLAELERLYRSDFGRSHFIFRSVQDAAKHKLRPAVGRVIDGHQPYRASRERGLLERFKQQAALHLTSPPGNDWDWLALAQHHGVPTRLLVWSFNPLVATWFALKEPLLASQAAQPGTGSGGVPEVARRGLREEGPALGRQETRA